MLIPNKGRIIVQKIAEEKKEGLLIMPNTPNNEPYWVNVMNVSSNGLKATQKALIPAYAGTKINYKDEEYIILNEDDVLCYI